MSITITLPPEAEEKLRSRAADNGVAADALARDLLEQALNGGGTETRDSTIPWFQKYASAAPEVIRDFCKTHGIVSELKSAVSSAETCFQPSVIRLEEDVDPETGDRKVMIVLSVRNKAREEVLAAYQEFVRRSVATIPWPQRSLIGLSYDIL